MSFTLLLLQVHMDCLQQSCHEVSVQFPGQKFTWLWPVLLSKHERGFRLRPWPLQNTKQIWSDVSLAPGLYQIPDPSSLNPINTSFSLLSCLKHLFSMPTTIYTRRQNSLKDYATERSVSGFAREKFKGFYSNDILLKTWEHEKVFVCYNAGHATKTAVVEQVLWTNCVFWRSSSYFTIKSCEKTHHKTCHKL